MFHNDQNDDEDFFFTQRKDEIQTLESMYPEDFKIIQHPDATSFGKFTLKIYPTMDDDENFCNAQIMVKYVDKYPIVPPKIKVLKTWNLS